MTDKTTSESRCPAELETLLADNIERLAKVGYELWRATLVGGVPSAHERFKRMDNPQPNDVVMEVTAGPIRLRDRREIYSIVGHLISITREPYPLTEPWDEAEEGRPAPLEEVVYIRRLDTEETVRWTNAKFITILPKGGWR